MKKRFLAGILAIAMLLTVVSAWAESMDENASGTQVVVGSINQMSGRFFTDMWGNNTADIDVRALLHGYATIAVSESGTYQVDSTVVRSVSFKGQSDTKDKTFELELQDGLTYNDGTPITAADYVFSVLLLAAPEIRELGGVSSEMSQYVGYEAYHTGLTPAFRGVRLLDRLRFSLTISGETLPYFYELMLMNVTPYPIHVLAPDFQVTDEGDGAYLRYVGEGEAPALADVYRETILHPQTGYLYNPRVTSGPYQLVAYSDETHTASFEINPWYQGNYEGRKPTIDRIVFKQVYYETFVDELLAGTVDIVNKVSAGDAILRALTTLGETGEKIGSVNYLRAGYGFIGLSCELGVTQSVRVRQALAYLTDADAFVAEFLRSFAMRTYGYYGYGQWMASGMLERLNTELNPYALDVDAAIALLEADGFTLNADGAPYDAQAGGVRYRRADDGSLEPLSVRWAALSENPGCAALMTHTLPYMEQAGFEVRVDEMSFSEMLTHYYRQTEREYHMFYLATNFNYIFDPYYNFHPDAAYQGERNTSGIADEKLLALADELRHTEVGDNETYLERWLALQMRYNELLPTIPLYSNVYFDFHGPEVYGYLPNAYFSWASAILYTTYGYDEAALPEDAEEPYDEDAWDEEEELLEILD